VAWYERGSGPRFWKKHLIAKADERTASTWSAWLLPHDLDGDGDLDLLSHTLANGNLAWYENPGAEGVWTWRLIDNLPGVHCQAMEDLDRDGRPELIANHEGAIVWYRVPRRPADALPANYAGDPAGRPAWDRQTLARAGTSGQTHYLSFADLDGDGDRDLSTGAAEGGFLAWWERPADATLLWSRHLVRDDLPGATHLVPADVNGDGKLDLVYSRGHASGIGWLVGPGWTDARTIDDAWLDAPHTLAVADLDGDGDTDVVSAGRGNQRVAWWENDGRGGFARRPLDAAQSGNDVRVVDLDGDGDRDVILAGESSRNVVWFENVQR
jgi:hypothetical protein